MVGSEEPRRAVHIVRRPGRLVGVRSRRKRQPSADDEGVSTLPLVESVMGMVQQPCPMMVMVPVGRGVFMGVIDRAVVVVMIVRGVVVVVVMMNDPPDHEAQNCDREKGSLQSKTYLHASCVRGSMASCLGGLGSTLRQAGCCCQFRRGSR